MRVSSNLFTNNFLLQLNQLQGQQNQLQTQASTGLKITEPEDNPAVMDQVLNMQAEASANAQYQNNITQLQGNATLAAGAMNTLQTITERASEIATSASSGTTGSSQLAADATEVESLIQQAMQAANTTDANGNYIFSGTDSTAVPFSASTDASGNVTAVNYNGNAGTPSYDIGPGLKVSPQTAGANTTGTGQSGLLVDSRSGADLFSHLISLQQNLASGNTAAIASTDMPNLTKDEDNVVSAIAANGVMQSTLETAGNAASQTATNLTTQTSNLTSADMATTLTQLDQTQTAYQAAMQSGVMVMGMSILNFIQ